MFRSLIMAIFRLYMKYLLSNYTKHTWAVYMGWGGGIVGTRSRICQKVWAVWVTWWVNYNKLIRNLVTEWNPHVTHTAQTF